MMNEREDFLRRLAVNIGKFGIRAQFFENAAQDFVNAARKKFDAGLFAHKERLIFVRKHARGGI